MSIRGVGLDLVEVDRIRDMLERNREAILNRILHADAPRERFDKADAATHLAGLFALKEAVMKALGTGMAGARFSEIRVTHKDTGQPVVTLEGLAAEQANRMGVTSWFVSITHSKTTASAVAIGEASDS